MTRPSPRILGIDPGTLRAGWALIVGAPARPAMLECGRIMLPAKWPLERRLAALHDELSGIVTSTAPTHASVEAPFHGISARSALQLAHARGVVLAVLGRAGVPVTEFSPATIKKAVTGHGRAEKSQVATMVRLILRTADAALRDDVSDATAAALCHLYRMEWGVRVTSVAKSDRPA